jgi:hypothetical protein
MDPGSSWISAHLDAIPVAAPAGVLVKVFDSTGPYSSGLPCPLSGGVSWFYSPGSRARGEGAGGGPLLRPGTRFSFHLPPSAPFQFDGLMPDGERCSDPDQQIAFVVPASNRYRLSFIPATGAFAYLIDAERSSGSCGLSGSFTNVLSATTREIDLKQGVHTICLRANPNQGAARWTIRVDDLPPQITEPRVSRSIGAAGEVATFSYWLSEDANVDVDVIDRGRVIRSLILRKHAALGKQQFQWDGRAASGQPVPPGVYALRIRATDWRGRTAEFAIGYRIISPVVAADGRAGAFRIDRTTEKQVREVFGSPAKIVSMTQYSAQRRRDVVVGRALVYPCGSSCSTYYYISNRTGRLADFATNSRLFATPAWTRVGMSEAEAARRERKRPVDGCGRTITTQGRGGWMSVVFDKGRVSLLVIFGRNTTFYEGLC